MTSGYFPGSSQRLAPPPGIPDQFKIPEDLGKEFTIGGKEVRLYTIGELSQVLNRKPVTIRAWERNGTIPKAVYRKPSSDPRGTRRMWSHAQVEALLHAAIEERILYNPNAQISRTKFTEKVFEAFRGLQG